MSRMKLGMLLFIASESVFFALLIMAYIVYHTTSPSAVDASLYLDIPKTGAFSVGLIGSSFTMWLASYNFRADKRCIALIWLAVTIALGITFLVGEGMEYASLISKGITLNRNLFGTTYFTLTGFHAFHVFIGLILLTTLFGIGFKRSSVGRLSGLDGISIYWHFVDSVWVVIFTVIYIWALR